ncbi:MAG: restriction endonuclease [Symploca sp. SIO2E6]|nr:restriction endonuclease [Symploca sp. SIO2E6]
MQGLDYEKKIAGYDWHNLSELWKRIESGNTPGWESGRAFEYFILRAFQLEGAEVTWPYSVRVNGEELEQIDGVVYSDGLACLVECKDTASRISIEPIAKLRNQLQRRPATAIGSVFSRSGFTEPAFTLAQFITPQTVLLWSGEEIAYALENKCFQQGLFKKYRFCIELGITYYNIKIEDLS